MGIWCYAQLKTIGNPRAKNYPNLWHGVNFVPTLDNLKSFQYRHEIWEFYSTLRSLAALKNFEENLSTYFGSITVFMKEASKITVIFSAVFYPDSHVFKFFKIVQVYLHLAICRVYKGHLKNKWVIRTFQKHPKSSKFVCIKSCLQFMQNVYPFCRNSEISWNSSYRFLWNFTQQKTSTQSICSEKHFQRKCWYRLKFDLELNLLWCCCHTIFIANERPCEDSKLWGGNLIELCAIVPGPEKLLNRCNVD